MWTKRFLILALVPVIAFVAGCSNDDETPMGTTADAFVRVAHLSADAPAVDVYVDGSKVLSDVPYKAVSAYLKLSPGDYNFQVFVAGQTTDPVLDENATVEAGTRYTVAAVGLVTPKQAQALQAAIFVDDVRTRNDKARVRFVHSSADAPTVDITLQDGTPIFDNIAFPTASTYAEVDPGSYPLQVRTEDGNSVVLTFAPIELEANRVYTVYAIGLLRDDTLGAQASVDAPGQGDTVAPIEPAQSRVRVGHLSPDAPNVDIQVDGAVVASNVPFQAFTNYLALEPGQHRFQVFVSGGGGSPVLDESPTLQPNSTVTVAAVGLVTDGSLAVQIYADDNNVDSDMVRIRFAHASPDAPAVDITLTDGTKLFSNVEFPDATGYLTTAGGALDLQVRLAGTETVVASFQDIALSNGNVFTAYAIGLVTDGSLAALATRDAPSFASPGDVLNLAPGMAEARVGHLSPDAPNVDVWLDGLAVAGLTNVPYETISGYLMLPAKSTLVQVFVTGSSTNPVIDATLTLLPKTRYSILATGLITPTSEKEAFGPVVLIDDKMTVGDKAKVRFVHASPDAPNVDVALRGGATLFSNVAFNGFQPGDEYLEVGGGSYDLDVLVAGSTTIALGVDDLILEEGMNYTVFAIGLLGDQSLAALSVAETGVGMKVPVN